MRFDFLRRSVSLYQRIERRDFFGSWNRQRFKLESRDGDTSADAAECLIGNATVKQRRESRRADFGFLLRIRPHHVEMVFDDHRTMLLNEICRHLGGDQSARLFLGGRALQKHAWHADLQPFVFFGRSKIRLVAAFFGAVNEAARPRDSFRPDQRQSVITRPCAKL